MKVLLGVFDTNEMSLDELRELQKELRDLYAKITLEITKKKSSENCQKKEPH